MGDTDRNACVLGSDLGGTKSALAAVDGSGRIMFSREISSPSTDQEMMVRSLLDLVDWGVSSASEQGLDLLGIGLGVAGFILRDQGILAESPNVSWSMVPLRRLVGERGGLPTFLDNDANAAALGERFVGVCRGVDDFVCLTLGTGIGGGICADGKIYRGHRGTAAEIGHMIIEPDGLPCECGNRGCLETLASGTALEREATRFMSEDETSLLKEMCGGNPGALTGEMISAAAEEGDTAALKAFSYIAHYLGLGLVNLIHLFDPETVVLGGGVSHSGHLLLDEVKGVVQERGIPTLIEGTRIVLSTLGRDAGIIGSAALAWEGIGRLS
jgi:glucokinase